MITVYKYILTPAIKQIELHENYEILTAQVQYEDVCIWVKVNTDKPKVKVDFFVYGTGHAMREDTYLNYINTVQLHGGGLIFHLFYKPT